jgi:hypothetical protein
MLSRIKFPEFPEQVKTDEQKAWYMLGTAYARLPEHEGVPECNIGDSGIIRLNFISKFSNVHKKIIILAENLCGSRKINSWRVIMMATDAWRMYSFADTIRADLSAEEEIEMFRLGVEGQLSLQNKFEKSNPDDEYLYLMKEGNIYTEAFIRPHGVSSKTAQRALARLIAAGKVEAIPANEGEDTLYRKLTGLEG